MNTLPLPCSSILGAVLFVWGGVLFVPGCLFSHPTPLACEKDHIAPQLCQKRRTRKKKGGWVCVRVSRLSAWRLALKDTGSAGTPDRFLKSSTYNMHFKSYPVLRVLAWHAVRLQPNTLSRKGARVKECGECTNRERATGGTRDTRWKSISVDG